MQQQKKCKEKKILFMLNKGIELEKLQNFGQSVLDVKPKQKGGIVDDKILYEAI